MCVTEPTSPKGTLHNQQEEFHLGTTCWWLHKVVTCKPAHVVPQSFIVTTITNFKNLCHAKMVVHISQQQQKTEKTQLTCLVWSEATSVSIYFRLLAMKTTHYHSSLIDTFISEKWWKMHPRCFSFFTIFWGGGGMLTDPPSGMLYIFNSGWPLKES